MKVYYKNSFYKHSLLVLLGGLLIWSAYQIISGINLKLLLPFALYGGVLYLMLTGHPWVKLAIKVWSGFLFLAGINIAIWSLFMMVNQVKEIAHIHSMLIEAIVFGFLILFIGLLIFIGANRYVSLKEDKLEIDDHMILD